MGVNKGEGENQEDDLEGKGKLGREPPARGRGTL